MHHLYWLWMCICIGLLFQCGYWRIHWGYNALLDKWSMIENDCVNQRNKKSWMDRCSFTYDGYLHEKTFGQRGLIPCASLVPQWRIDHHWSVFLIYGWMSSREGHCTISAFAICILALYWFWLIDSTTVSILFRAFATRIFGAYFF